MIYAVKSFANGTHLGTRYFTTRDKAQAYMAQEPVWAVHKLYKVTAKGAIKTAPRKPSLMARFYSTLRKVHIL